MSDPAAIPQVFPVTMVENPFSHPVKDPRAPGVTIVGMPLAAVPRGWRLQSLLPFFDEYRQRPAQRRGTACLDEKSFVEYVKRFMNSETTVLFVRRRLWAWRVTAVFDFHPPGPDIDRTGSCSFRAWTVVKDATALMRATGLQVFWGREP